MVKTIDYPILKSPIAGGHGPLDKLKVEIGYQKGGFSMLSGEYSDSGVYAYLTPCAHENGITSTYINGDLHTMGFKILLKKMGRKSQKQIDLAASLIIPYTQQIADYYSKREYDAMHKLIMKVYSSNKYLLWLKNIFADIIKVFALSKRVK